MIGYKCILNNQTMIELTHNMISDHTHRYAHRQTVIMKQTQTDRQTDRQTDTLRESRIYVESIYSIIKYI